MIEIIIVLGMLMLITMAMLAIYTVFKNTESYIEYSKNEAKAACTMEDYKLATRKM